MPVPLTAREPVEFTPPSAPHHLLEIDPATDQHKFAIIVRVPTPVERDSYNAVLVRAGVTSYTKEQIRNLSLAAIQDLYDEAEHDELQTLLREVWAAADAQSEVEDLQRKKLLELLEKARAKGGKDAVPDTETVKKELAEIRPEVVIDPKRRIRATAISQEVMARFEPLREVIAGLVGQDAKRSWINAEVYVKGWRGLEHQPDGNGRGGLTHHEVTYLRQEIGQEAFLELSDFITAMMGLDEDEEKNLASLLESMSAQIGSTQPTSTASSDNGTSTDEPTGEILGSTTSLTTTAKSSASSTSSKTRKRAGSRSGRTARRSSTSP